jgi:hypothetical protein
MTAAADLDRLRPVLLELHRTLLDAQRIRYEREHGRVESRGELLDLALHEPSFEWLRVLSAQIAHLDELAASEERTDEDLRAAIGRLRVLLRFDGNGGFAAPYREIVDSSPDALIAHVRCARALARIAGAAP